jgi:hypothetical protein
MRSSTKNATNVTLDSRLETHETPLLKKLLLREENRRLKRNWPIDLI